MTDPQQPSSTPDPAPSPDHAAGRGGHEQRPYAEPGPNSYGAPGGYDQQQPYGQPDYGQAGYGQHPYGQQEYGRPEYGQPYGLEYGQPGYGVSTQPYGTAPDHPQGTLILVFGVAGFFVGVLGPVAWIMGSRALREIRATGAHPANEQMIVIGRILGIVVTVFMILGVLALLLLLVVGLAASGV